jgi:hypothetical protein
LLAQLKLSDQVWWLLKMSEGLLSATAHSDVEQCAWCVGDAGNGEPVCEHWELFSATWPTSGMMLDGKVFELPMLERPTTDSESSLLPIPEQSLFRTPQAKGR